MIVTTGTGLVVYFRFNEIALSTTEDADQPAISRPVFTLAFTLAAFLFGIVVAVAFGFADGRWPDMAQQVFLGMGIGLTLFFSVGAAVVRPRENMGGVAEVIVMNMLWGLGYGGLLPLIIQ